MEQERGKYSELFRVIEDYARKDYGHQDKALQVIAGAYVFMFERDEMPDARPVIDGILEQYDYVFTTLDRGNLDPLSVDAVVRVALYADGYTEWGLSRLARILKGLHRRSQTDETYTDYVEDSRVVIRGLETVIAGSALEDLVEAAENGG